ncbi:hypothetical protein ACF0H5_001105 [Mactra antiquata]
MMILRQIYTVVILQCHIYLWIAFLKVDHVTSEVCTDGRSCDYGCCKNDDNTPVCCDKPFWTWGVIVGISVGAILGIVIIVFCVLTCIYCKKKPAHTSRLRHTVSMRSNRIRPFPDLPPYEETNSHPEYELPPKYEDIVGENR